MQPGPPIGLDLVLLGGGHAHVEVLRRFALRPLPGLRITIVAREPLTPYTGMLPAVIRGEIPPAEAHIDLAPLAAAARTRLFMAEAEALDLAARRVLLAHGHPPLSFDLLSIDVGGLPAAAPAAAIPVKPIGRFLAALAGLESTLPQAARIAVVGGGAGGVELALALARRFTLRAAITLVSATAEVPAEAPPRARRIARAALDAARITLALGTPAEDFRNGRLHLRDGTTIPADAALWTTGVVGPPFLAASGLACDPSGAVRVAPTLESLSHPGIFAAGDCAAVAGSPRPKAGVWAVRAGPPLAANLRRAALGVKLRPWHPQPAALAILGLGGGRALAWRGNRFVLSGRAVARWKEWLDRRWIAMYRPGAQSGRMRMPAMEEEMRCAGCGGKIGAQALTAALASLAATSHPDIMLGLAAAEDAAVTRVPAGKLLVQSVDHFRAFLDDPWLFGEIAAVHALSDIYAMGGQPWTALAIAAVPFMGGAKMAEELAAMMAGAARALDAAGCALIGGHSAEAAEAALGFAVTGLADPDRLLLKSALRPGERLILTKKLGTGILLAARPRGLLGAADLASVIEMMRKSNCSAARILLAHGVRAATDITGFGLAGHLNEMLRASNVGATLDLAALPALPGALDLAASSIASTLAAANRALLAAALGGEPPAHPAIALLIDPQTSGGILAGIAPEHAQSCLSDLSAAGIPATLIGTVIPDPFRLSLTA